MFTLINFFIMHIFIHFIFLCDAILITKHGRTMFTVERFTLLPENKTVTIYVCMYVNMFVGSSARTRRVPLREPAVPARRRGGPEGPPAGGRGD